MNASKVWYVTGASQGLGLVLVKKLLANGYRVAACSRDAGNPDRAAELFMELAERPEPPMHLFVGSDAYVALQKS